MRREPEEEGEPVDRMLPRSLMIPPGFPDFASRERHMDLGPTTVRGRAWSGAGTIERVELSANGGESWRDATLGPQPSRWAWRAWSWDWAPSGPGRYELCCRATDATGASQPLTAGWNLGGYANNGVQRVGVVVE
jgi:hypothetical protein